MKDATPEQIGRYIVRRRLGGGGMGVVYLAHDPVIDRPVAVKVLRTSLDDEDMRERFAREVRSTGALVHRNIVTVYDAGEHHGLPFIAMEYVDGRSAQEIIQKQEPLSLDARLALVEDLCAGLAYAHQRGLIHRDIKPANLMVGTDGVLRILDFGIARLMDASRASFTTVGTPGYMSPEQILADKVDHRSDLFGVGLVLYELLSYKRAFAGTTLPRIMHAVLHDQPKPLAEGIPGLDPGIIAIVERSLQKDADDRYPDAWAMATDVRGVRVRLGATPEALHTPLPVPAVLPTVVLDGQPVAADSMPRMPSLPRTATASYSGMPGTMPGVQSGPISGPASVPPTGTGTGTKTPRRLTGTAMASVAAAVVIIVGAGGWLASRRNTEPPAPAAAAPEPVQRDPEHRWVNIPAGEFQMGCVPGDVCAEDEQHRHKVRISHSYELTATEVTWGQYQRYAKAHNITPPPVPEYKIEKDYPVVNVTWEEASAYCKAYGGRLPTEAEWEKGARGGQQGWKRAWGSGDPTINGHPAANLGDESYRRATGMRDIEMTASPGDPPIWLGYDDGFGHAAPVATFAPNAYGLHDVSGNVQEWVSDFESEDPNDYKTKNHEVDPTGPAKGEKRGVRGDAFWFRPKWSRLSARQFVEPDRRESDLGFRCAR